MQLAVELLGVVAEKAAARGAAFGGPVGPVDPHVVGAAAGGVRSLVAEADPLVVARRMVDRGRGGAVGGRRRGPADPGET